MNSMLTVRLFARYAELLGAPEVRVSAEGIATVGDLLARLRTFPGAGAIGPGTLVAVNLRQARADAPVSPEDEIALLPPLAGG